MLTDYDPIAEHYQRAKAQPWRAAIEAYTLLSLIGDPTGLAIIDLACGEGYYTRLLRQRGAARIKGIDLSERMIGLARQQETNQHLGIDYVVGDAKNIPADPCYDLAVAAFLLNYARDRAELGAMCAAIARCLRPGGRFVTVNSSPLLDFSTAPSYRPYGFEATLKGPFTEGAPITWTIFLESGPFDIENYFLDAQCHEEAFRAAGFRTITWHAPQLAPDAEAANGREYWEPLLKHPPMAFIECIK